MVASGAISLFPKDALGAPAKNTYFLCTDGKRTGDIYNRFKPTPGTLCVIDANTFAMSVIQLPLYGHVPIQSKINPNLCVTVEKLGVRAAEIDFIAKKMTREFKTAEGNRFYGHAVYSNDGKFLFTSEMNDRLNRGEIVVRDASSLKVVTELPSHGLFPHDLQMAKDGKSLIVVNQGETSPAPRGLASAGEVRPPSTNLSWIDFSSGKLLKQMSILENKYASIGHFAIDSAGWIVAVGSHTERAFPVGRSFIISPEGKQSEFHPEIQSATDNEFFSVALDEKLNVAVISAPAGNQIHFLNYRTNKLLKTINCNIPRALAFTNDMNHVIIADRIKVRRFQVKDAELSTPTALVKLPGIRGPHMIKVEA